MSEIKMNVSLPLDDDQFFRRECPLCNKEFKVLLTKEELADLAQKGIDSFMIEQDQEKDTEQSKDLKTEYICPYCGQKAPEDSWWTQEQLSFFGVIAQNITAQLVNEHLIQPLKKIFNKP